MTMANMEKTMENLKKRGYDVTHFTSKEAVVPYLLSEIGDRAVGLGGSMTIKELGLFPALLERGETHWHWEQTGDHVRKLANDCPVYIMSANGVSESGQMINIDGNGNRVANMCFGHDVLYFIIGKNKIAPDDKMALWRARNVASVKNVRRFGYPAPCMAGDELKCFDCDHPNRICKVFVTLEQKPSSIPKVEVILVDEALGF